MRVRIAGALFALATLVTAACGGSGVADPAQNINEQFSFTLHVGNADGLESGLHFFDVHRTGEIFVTLNSLTPPLPLFGGLGILVAPATTAHDQCLYTSPVNSVTLSTKGDKSQLALPNQVVNAGAYCLIVSDVGSFKVDETYVVTVSHP
jgi:hypothetical protein